MAAPREATDADRRMQQSRALRTRARQLQRTGRFAEARTLLEQSLAIAESFGEAMTRTSRWCNSILPATLWKRRTTCDRASSTSAPSARSTRRGAPRIPIPPWRDRVWRFSTNVRANVLKAEAAVRDILPLLERSIGPAIRGTCYRW